MGSIKNIPFADRKHIDQLPNRYGKELLPLPPCSLTVARAASSSATLAALLGAGAGSIAYTITTEEVLHIKAGGYPLVWRWRYGTDTLGITNLAGALPYDDTIPANSETWRGVPDGATSLILDYLTVEPAITVIGT